MFGWLTKSRLHTALAILFFSTLFLASIILFMKPVFYIVFPHKADPHYQHLTGPGFYLVIGGHLTKRKFMYVKALQSCFWVFGGIKYEAEQGGQHAGSEYSANLADDHLPPRSSYSRPEGSKVPISARATAEMKALVEHAEWSSIFGPQTEGPSPVPGLDHATLTEYLTVSIEGTVSGRRITSFTVTSVEPSKP